MRTNHLEQDRFSWPRWFDLAFRLYLVALVAASMCLSGSNLAAHLGLIPEASDLGVDVAKGSAAPGWARITAVRQDGPLDRAGISPGDLIRPDRPLEFVRSHRVGEHLGFAVSRDGKSSHLTITLPENPEDPATRTNRLAAVAEGMLGFVVMAFSGTLLWRRWREKAATCLGLLVLAMGVQFPGVPAWIDSDNAAIAWFWLMAMSIGLYGFAPAFAYYVSGNVSRRWHPPCLWSWLAAVVLASAYYTWSIQAQPQPWFVAQGLSIAFFPGLSLPLAMAIITARYSDASAVGKNRLKVIALAFLMLFASSFLVAFARPANLSGTSDMVLRVVGSSLYLLSSGLLVYAVLRHRLFDFGFAVNRTLVFTLASAILLTSFGLGEWAVHHLVPEEWNRESALYSAGIALLLFLIFHRIRDRVEQLVEHWFFADWHANETTLRRFVETASHFEQWSGLTQAAVSELRRFTGSDDVALYWRGEDRAFHAVEGRLAGDIALVDADDPALVRTRTDRAAIRLTDTLSSLPAKLVLPIIGHDQLAGFFAVGTKPDAMDYRPDEFEVLAWAARQIGLDLQAMRARQLEEKVMGLEAQVERLSAIVAARG